MRATASLTLLSAAAGLASAALKPAIAAMEKPAIIVVEKSLGNAYRNTTVEVHPEYDFEDAAVLDQVSTLYQVGPEYTYFCFAYRPDGAFYSDDWFGLDKPLRLSTNNVVVKAITCRVE
ncbi:hypothetical protein SAMD00023353_5500410 [Rosellinia necatrix]|uniref:Uncharacterized protein n=1 Tax=Rosellinia necatrix TaxID=77044 RepID=A0A1W2TQW6_ROSNE|nr:hypothetical protein SAMD00023353_5500410 [Rosellinia necatrix]